MLGTSNDRVGAGMKIEVFPDDQEFLVHRSGLKTLYVWSTTPNLRDGDIQLEYQMRYPGDHIPESGSITAQALLTRPIEAIRRTYNEKLEYTDRVSSEKVLLTRIPK